MPTRLRRFGRIATFRRRGGFPGVAERFVAPIVVSRQGFEFGKLADESDVTTLSNDFEFGPAFELEVIAEFLRYCQASSVVELCGSVLLVAFRIFSRTHIIALR